MSVCPHFSQAGPTRLCALQRYGGRPSVGVCRRCPENPDPTHWPPLPSAPLVLPARVTVHRAPPRPDAGPGTELKKLLAKVGITATASCACNARARQMDQQGVDWCRANLETIVDWLAEEAARRHLPFLRAVGRRLVRLAIIRAEARHAHSSAPAS